MSKISSCSDGCVRTCGVFWHSRHLLSSRFRVHAPLAAVSVPRRCGKSLHYTQAHYLLRLYHLDLAWYSLHGNAANIRAYLDSRGYLIDTQRWVRLHTSDSSGLVGSHGRRGRAGEL